MDSSNSIKKTLLEVGLGFGVTSLIISIISLGFFVYVGDSEMASTLIYSVLGASSLVFFSLNQPNKK